MTTDKTIKEKTKEEKIVTTAAAAETIKKGKYRVYNGSGYDTVHLETVADQVIENENKKFVSQAEKTAWNLKASGEHHHDSVYAKLANTYDKGTVDGKLDLKANATHGHQATDIITDSTHRFATDVEKTRWNNTYTREESNDNYYTKGQADGKFTATSDYVIQDLFDKAEIGKLKTGFYKTNPSTKNLPNDAGINSYNTILLQFENTSQVTGTMTLFARNENIYNVRFLQGHWEAWKKLATTDDIHGAKMVKHEPENRYTYSQILSWYPKANWGYNPTKEGFKLKENDKVIFIIKPSDRNFSVTIFGKASNVTETNFDLTGLGMSTSVDAYSKTEADDKFESKLVTRNLDSVGADCNKIIDGGKYKFANHVKNTPYDQKCHGILEHIVYDNHWCQIATVVSIIDKVARTDERWIRYLTDFSKKTWSPWTKVATTDDLHGAKIIPLKQTYQTEYNTWYGFTTKDSSQRFTSNTIENITNVIPKLKVNDFIILTQGRITNSEKKVTLYGYVEALGSSTIDVKCLGMSTSVDAYSKAEMESKYYDKDTIARYYLRQDAAESTYAKKSEVTSSLSTKAEKIHKHAHTEITGLGSAATKNIGTGNGNIPVLNAQGKLEETVLPKIAINDVFTADSTEAAMKLTVEVGDILVLNQATIAASLEAKSIFTYTVDEEEMTLSDEYVEYLTAGKMTYLCVDKAGKTFEDKFKPLQSSTDTISKGEVEKLLAKKVDATTLDAYKKEVTNNLSTKVAASTLESYKQEVTQKLSTKVDVTALNSYKAEVTASLGKKAEKTYVDSSLSNKVDKEPGKGLSTNDFTTAEKQKLNGIANNANNYSHPSGDGNLHVPATSTNSNGKVLMAGSTAGTLNWTALTADNIAETGNKKFLTPSLISKWDAKAENKHSHNEYRTVSDSLSATQTRQEIEKLKTIISSSQPGPGSQAIGAVWIEESK